jgi:hypothetical protein
MPTGLRASRIPFRRRAKDLAERLKTKKDTTFSKRIMGEIKGKIESRRIKKMNELWRAIFQELSKAMRLKKYDGRKTEANAKARFLAQQYLDHRITKKQLNQVLREIWNNEFEKEDPEVDSLYDEPLDIFESIKNRKDLARYHLEEKSRAKKTEKIHKRLRGVGKQRPAE